MNDATQCASPERDKSRGENRTRDQMPVEVLEGYDRLWVSFFAAAIQSPVLAVLEQRTLELGDAFGDGDTPAERASNRALDIANEMFFAATGTLRWASDLYPGASLK